MKEIKIEYIETKKLKLNKNNPRKNDKAVDTIIKSIEKYGFKNPVICDSNLVVYCGNTRLKAALKMGLENVPCIIADDLSPEQIREYALIDNKSNEIAEWDFDLLADELSELDLSDFDFDWGIDNILDEEKEVIEDEAPEIDEEAEPICKIGDIWQLGKHRLMCGDSTDKETVTKLMNGEKADMVFTDPPYGMGKEKDGVKNDNLYNEKLLDFNKKWIPLSFEFTKDNGSWYCWGIDEPLMDVYGEILKPMIKAKQITFRNLITWDKEHGQGQLTEKYRMYAIADEKCVFIMLGHQEYGKDLSTWYEGFEPFRAYMIDECKKIGLTVEHACKLTNSYASHCFGKSQYNFPTREIYETLREYAKGKAFKKEYDEIKKEYDEIKKEWYATRAYFDNTHDNMNNVWHFSRTSKKERELTGGHATPKPIALCARGIKSSSREGEIVLDLFSGSGSTLIACEQLNRKCYMMELDPKYCDVIIKRWENLTGEKAVKI